MSADAYALCLWIALVALGVELAILWAAQLRPPLRREARLLAGLAAFVASLVALGAGALHFLGAHRGAVLEPMTLVGFVAEHRAVMVIAGAGLAAGLTARFLARV